MMAAGSGIVIPSAPSVVPTLRPAHYHSITEHQRSEPFELQVARGLVGGHSLVNIFGYQAAIGTTSICVWENAAPYVFPESPVQLILVSTSAADTGISKFITGLDDNYEPISETVVINGTTPVTTVNQYLRINNVRTTSGNAVGTVTLTNGGITYAKLLPGTGQTQMSQYTVPAGHTFYLNRVDTFTQLSGGSNNFCTYDVLAMLENGTKYSVLQAPFTQRYEARRIVPFPYAEKTSLQWHASTDSSTAAVGMVIEGILIKNTI
jgi:hypothetical protein